MNQADESLSCGGQSGSFGSQTGPEASNQCTAFGPGVSGRKPSRQEFSIAKEPDLPGVPLNFIPQNPWEGFWKGAVFTHTTSPKEFGRWRGPRQKNKEGTFTQRLDCFTEQAKSSEGASWNDFFVALQGKAAPFMLFFTILLKRVRTATHLRSSSIC